MVLKKTHSKKKKSTPGNVAALKSKYPKVFGYYEILMIIGLLFIDRITKIWAMTLQQPIDYGFLAFTFVTNTGAGFSIFENMNMFLAAVAIFATVALIYFKKYIPAFSFITVLSGTVGNLIDRLAYDGVIDFINFKFWPIFNIADTLIFIGVAYWILVLIREKK